MDGGAVFAGCSITIPFEFKDGRVTVLGAAQVLRD